LQALVDLWQINEATRKRMKRWIGKIIVPSDLRNRAVHDKRMVDAASKEVARFQITARVKLEFSPRPEKISELEQLRQQLYLALQEFAELRDTIVAELDTSPQRRTPPLVRITTAMVRSLSPEPPSK
jgi:response regulator RpfG family c-di-GMP phosphodiesterase